MVEIRIFRQNTWICVRVCIYGFMDMCERKLTKHCYQSPLLLFDNCDWMKCSWWRSYSNSFKPVNSLSTCPNVHRKGYRSQSFLVWLLCDCKVHLKPIEASALSVGRIKLVPSKMSLFLNGCLHRNGCGFGPSLLHRLCTTKESFQTW